MSETIPADVLRSAISKVTGEDAVLVDDVRWDLRHPCADCPFVKTSPYHEGVAESLATSHAAAIMQQRFAHTCHKTDTRETCDGPVSGKETGRPVQHCAGALMMLLKTGAGMDLQLPLLQALDDGKLRGEDLRELTARAKADPAIFTLPQMLRFYEDELAKRCRGLNLRKRNRSLAKKLARR